MTPERFATCGLNMTCSAMRKIIKIINKLEDHWLGDLIGVVSLFGAGCIFLLLGYGLGH